MKSIRAKLVTAIVIIFFVFVVGISLVTGVGLNNATSDTLQATMTELSGIAASNIAGRIQEWETLLTEMATSAELVGVETTPQAQQDFIAKKNEQYHERYGCDIFYADRNGSVLGTSLIITDREFFTKGMAGEEFLSDPIVRKDTGKLGYTYVVPVLRDGRPDGVLYMIIDFERMQSVISAVSIGERGDAYAVNAAGTTVVFNDEQMVAEGYNTAQAAQTDASLAELAGFETRAAKGEAGFGVFTHNGEDSYASYGPIDNTNGWGVIVTAKRQEFTQYGQFVTLFTIGMSILLGTAGAVILTVMAGKIARPLRSMTKRMEQLSRGDLDSPVKVSGSRDEVGMLNKSMSRTIESLRAYVENIGAVTGKMAANDLNVSVDLEYEGNFTIIKTSLEQIIGAFNHSLRRIGESAEQVASGSDQVSSAAQGLSQGATEQASAVQELAATVNEISAQVKRNAENALDASRKADHVGEEMLASKGQMEQMIGAMGEISGSSSEIGKIIKTIEDIAFQTNILALNAAVEAARAGAAGKGFAVVADEVRSLATKSQEASKSTSSLIANSLRAVENGTKIADETARSLLSAVDGAKEVTKTVDKISRASSEQAAAIAQVTQGIEQISGVVQTNSATSEESAAASEELSGQAQLLKKLVGEFHLKEDTEESCGTLQREIHEGAQYSYDTGSKY